MSFVTIVICFLEPRVGGFRLRFPIFFLAIQYPEKLEGKNRNAQKKSQRT